MRELWVKLLRVRLDSEILSKRLILFILGIYQFPGLTQLLYSSNSRIDQASLLTKFQD